MAVNKIPDTFKGGAVGNVYRCSVRANTPFGDHVNTFAVRQVTASFTGSVFDDIHQTWAGAVKTSYLAQFPSTFTLLSFRVAQIDDSLKGLPAVSYAESGAGTRVPTGDALPPQDACVLDMLTGFTGRRGRGRQFIGYSYEIDQAGGVYNSTYRALVDAYGNALRTTFVPATAIAELVIFTKVSNSVISVTSTVARAPVYTQRRRRLGVGS